MKRDIIWMQRALELAQRGIGAVEPNPRVGCVITYKDRILGEGYHQQFGGPHAEVHALHAIATEDRSLLPEATLYVTLEPCAHQGKTPPCAHRIVHEKIGRVVIATLDPNPQVAGRGKILLEEAGISVEVGLLEEDAKAINRPFFVQHTLQRPYVTLKWAQSADGFLGKPGQRTALTGPIANRRTHQWRVEHQAILIGQETARVDNPQLTNRLWPGRTPIRIVWDPDGSLPKDLHLWDGVAPTWVLTHDPATHHPNAITHVLPAHNWSEVLQSILMEHSIQSVLVEGGAHTLTSFIEASWWDEYRVWTTAAHLSTGVTAPGLPTVPTEECQYGPDTVKIGYRI